MCVIYLGAGWRAPKSKELKNNTYSTKALAWSFQPWKVDSFATLKERIHSPCYQWHTPAASPCLMHSRLNTFYRMHRHLPEWTMSNSTELPILVLTPDTQGNLSKLPTGSPGFPTLLMRIPAPNLSGTRGHCCTQQPKQSRWSWQMNPIPRLIHEAFGKLRETKLKTTKQMVLAGKRGQREESKRDRDNHYSWAQKQLKRVQVQSQTGIPMLCRGPGRAHHHSHNWHHISERNKCPGSQGISRGKEVSPHRKGHQKTPQMKTWSRTGHNK